MVKTDGEANSFICFIILVTGTQETFLKSGMVARVEYNFIFHYKACIIWASPDSAYLNHQLFA